MKSYLIFLSSLLTVTSRQAGAQCSECCLHGPVWGRRRAAGACADQGPGPRPPQWGDGDHQVSGQIGDHW